MALLIYKAQELKPYTFEVWNWSYWATKEKAEAALVLLQKGGSPKHIYRVVEITVYHTVQEQLEAQPFW